jgi:hypothetical protein
MKGKHVEFAVADDLDATREHEGARPSIPPDVMPITAFQRIATRSRDILSSASDGAGRFATAIGSIVRLERSSEHQSPLPELPSSCNCRFIEVRRLILEGGLGGAIRTNLKAVDEILYDSRSEVSHLRLESDQHRRQCGAENFWNEYQEWERHDKAMKIQNAET